MSYKTAWFCVNCDREMSYHAVMYSHGRCSMCGFKGEDAATIVETYEKAYKIIKEPSGKWWKPSKKVREYLEEK